MITETCENLTEYILIHYRWVFVCIFLLPISFFYNTWMYFRNWIVFKSASAPKQHANKVKNIQKQIRQWCKTGKKTKLCTGRPGWQTVCFRRPLYKNIWTKIDVNLVDVLTIDEKKTTVTVEPMVTMGQLTRTLNPLGWTIPVVPEIDELTIGGLVMGTGVESSSHKYGLFQHICVSFELVLSDGQVVKCSENENTELFYSIPWSYGTFGFLTAVEIKLIRSKPYIKLNYVPVKGGENIVSKFNECSRNLNNDFVEGLVFSENEAVIMTGVQSDYVELDKLNSIGRWYKPWFFIHVKNMLTTMTPRTEYIPLRDYYHRHTKSIFWEMQDIIPFGNNIIFRFLLGWLMPVKISLLKLTQTKTITKMYNNNHVLQDMLVPLNTLSKSLKLFKDTFNIYPVWLCPLILPIIPGMVASKSGKDELYVDIGLYGVPKVKDFKPKESIRKIEKYVTDVNGFQMLYADTFMTKEEFRKMFNHRLYDKIRAKLNCEQAFAEIYDKVRRDVRE